SLVNLPGTYDKVANILEDNSAQIRRILEISGYAPETEMEIAANEEKLATALLTLGRHENAENHEREAISIYQSIPAGTNVSVEEIAPAADGNYTLKRYESTDYSGAAADNDGRVVISSGKNATVVVTNKYTPKATAVDLDIKGTKNFHLEGSDSHTAGAFTFIVEKWNGTAWEEIESKSAVLEYAANEGESTKYFTIEDVLAGETFDRAGAYSYQVREEIGSVSNVTYDRTLYTFTVNVADVNGQLVATVTDKDNEEIENGEYAVEFNNSYNTATVSIDIKKDVADTSNNPLTSKAGFEFVAQTAVVGDDGAWSVKDGGRSFSVFSDAAGEARMTDVYKEAGVYYYIISEAAGSADGWSYSDVKYNVTVVVAKDSASGKLSADMTIEAVNGGDQETATVTDGTNGTIVFTNTYDPRDAEISLNALVKKELSGKAMIGGEFEFEIYTDGDRTTALATGTNDASGNVTFVPEKLTFSEVDNYFFDIIEKSGENGGITYDGTVYDLVVEVYDAGDGTLGARYYFEDSVDTTVTFKNTYTVTPVEIVIDGVKTLNVLSGSKSQKAGEYTFGLFDEAGNKIGETTNLENGTFRFDAITYGAEDIGKTYTYTVREIAPDGTTDGSYSAGGVKWSAQSFTVTVKITDNGDGTLSAETEGNGRDNISFVNTYSSKPVSVAVRGRKILENRDLVDGEFTFSLFETGSDFTNPVLVNGDITHDAEGWISIDLGTLGSGYHYFLVKENVPEDPAAGISYSGAVYAVSVNVFDNGKGQMEYSLSVVNLGSGASEDIVFTNVYNPVETRIPLGGTKIYNGGVELEEGEFSVGLYYEGELIDTAEVKADGSFDFNELGFGAANVGNTYVLTVEEIIPEGATDNGDGTKTFGNVIYDASSYTVLITVEDEVKDGVLEITKTVEKDGEEAETISFTNTFVPDPIEYTVSAEKTYDKGLKGNDFDFTLVSADGKTNVNQTKKNDVSGAVTFDPVIFDAAGEYKFTLTEKKDGILSFIRPSDAEYEITVTVVMENGVLSVADVVCVNTKNTGESDLKFENVYVLDDEDEITLSGTKKLTGDRTTVEANEFEFGLYDSEGNLTEAVKNDADGKFAFTALKFDETGIPVNGSKEYTYTVKEIAGDNARYTYDSTVYTVVVTVKDNDEGGIDVSYTVNGAPDTEIEFTNTYKDPAPVTYTPVAKKIYNKPLKGGDFKFSLEGEINGTEIKQEKTNAADGSITFDELSFPEAGTYTFKVKEIAKLLGFIKYS
ncbi:MAG: hypothetical protein II350_03170, partial [Clostridia bacterium]|nr:hypothetical protein [Clostridia bacterium]